MTGAATTSIEIAGGAAGPEEAAAIAAAVERFEADTAPPPAAPEPAMSAWQRAALIEAVSARQIQSKEAVWQL